MSTRLRMPFALLAASVMVLFSSGAALAGPGDPSDTEVTGIPESLPGTTTSGSAQTSDDSSSAARTTGPAEPSAQDFSAADVTVTLTQITTITLTPPSGSTTATNTGGPTTDR